jgi:hypothetical protein
MHEDRRCATCANWIMTKEQVTSGRRSGQCHRYAPRPTLAGSEAPGAPVMWPITLSNDVCGEWYYGGETTAESGDKDESPTF